MEGAGPRDAKNSKNSTTLDLLWRGTNTFYEKEISAKVLAKIDLSNVFNRVNKAMVEFKLNLNIE
jgi:hypothetical protein